VVSIGVEVGVRSRRGEVLVITGQPDDGVQPEINRINGRAYSHREVRSILIFDYTSQGSQNLMRIRDEPYSISDVDRKVAVSAWKMACGKAVENLMG
jgi:hypothetical protein